MDTMKKSRGIIYLMFYGAEFRAYKIAKHMCEEHNINYRTFLDNINRLQCYHGESIIIIPLLLR